MLPLAAVLVTGFPMHAFIAEQKISGYKLMLTIFVVVAFFCIPILNQMQAVRMACFVYITCLDINKIHLSAQYDACVLYVRVQCMCAHISQYTLQIIFFCPFNFVAKLYAWRTLDNE